MSTKSDTWDEGTVGGFELFFDRAFQRLTWVMAILIVVTVVGVIALGAAADPATGLPHTSSWVIPHLVGALAGIAFIGLTFYVAWQNISANHQVIADVLEHVHRIRVERGLEV